MRIPIVAVTGLTLVLLLPGLSASQTQPQVAPLAAPKPLTQTEAPQWLYPEVVRGVATVPTPRHVPGSSVTYTDVQLRDLGHTVDWRPEEHLPMPAVVATGGADGGLACGFCHLATGQGRPESAPVAGLPAAYFIGQLQAFASRDRHSSNSGGARPDGTISDGRWAMNMLSARMTPEDMRAAADYYAGIKYKPWITVVESDTAPPLTYDTGYPIAHPDQPAEPIAGRIVEFGDDADRAFMRDPDVGFTALVPKGSIARGMALVQSGAGAAPCAKCHGADLTGGAGAIGPPIAGRSPTYIARALFDFNHGNRDDPAARPMKPSAAKLSLDDMVAIAAYVGTLQP